MDSAEKQLITSEVLLIDIFMADYYFLYTNRVNGFGQKIIDYFWGIIDLFFYDWLSFISRPVFIQSNDIPEWPNASGLM